MGRSDRGWVGLGTGWVGVGGPGGPGTGYLGRGAGYLGPAGPGTGYVIFQGFVQIVRNPEKTILRVTYYFCFSSK